MNIKSIHALKETSKTVIYLHNLNIDTLNKGLDNVFNKKWK